ncbi:MAG: aminoglycoside phosphotransferase family protein [Nanoarchaeota archaeon]|nr:aminoglycoside phosphotransferase family protein [Nanoarchaeota archaeon]
MGIKNFFEEKGYSDAEIVNERIGFLNLVYTIKAGGETFFYKKAEEKTGLPTPINPDRVFNEWKAINAAKTVIPEHVPEIFDFSKENNVIITKAPSKKEYTLLRYELLDGNLNLELIKKIAIALKKLHTIKQGDFNKELFEKANIDFWYKELAKEYPKVIEKLIENLNQEKCLTHADFNPKNIVVFEDGFYIIDWEKAFISSPEHDIGNMLAHFVIKGIHLGREDYLKVPEIFLEAYGEYVDKNIINGHIGVLMWARIKSSAKARYLTSETSQKVLEGAHKYLREFKL